MTSRILIIAHGHPELSPGGGEIAAYQLFQELQRREGVEAWFVGADDPTRPASPLPFSNFKGRSNEFVMHARGVDPHLFSQRSRYAIGHFASLVTRLRPDIVHFHHYTNLGLELIAVARQAIPAARIVLTLHEYLAICLHHGQMVKTGSLALCESASPDSCAGCFPAIAPAWFSGRWEFIRSHFDHVDVFISPSQFLRRRYIDWGLSPGAIVVIPNGAAAAEREASFPSTGRRRTRFGFFGQINPYKGLTQLLSAFERLAATVPQEIADFRLHVHGVGLEVNSAPFTASVRGLLARTSQHTRFYGPYERAELDALMSDVDWVIVPSVWWENAPLVIAEALARRRPVLCSNIGGMAEAVLPGRDGFHFPVGDSEALARLLLAVTADPAIWEKLHRLLILPPTIAKSADDHLNLYRQ